MPRRKHGEAEEKTAHQQEGKSQGRGVIIRGDFVVDDAKRLKKAFLEGKLREFGVTAIEIETPTGTKRWTEAEIRKKVKGNKDQIDFP
jgi:hypothetical protein